MFPSSEIESFYQEFKRGNWLCSDLMAIAPLCEAWILSLDELTPSGFPHLPLSPDSSQPQYSADRMLFAVSAALCIPSEATGAIFLKHLHYLLDNGVNIGRRITDISKIMGHEPTNPKIDVLQAFSFLPHSGCIDAAEMCYSTNLARIQIDAIGWDNLPVFLHTLPENQDEARTIALRMMSQFHGIEGTNIYNNFIINAVDERDFFRAKISALRTRLKGNYAESLGWFVEHGSKFATLLPNRHTQLRTAPNGVTTDLIFQPYFAEMVRMDAEHVVKDFFDRELDLLRNPKNSNLVAQASRAFLEAGIPAEAIISWAVFRRDASKPFVRVELALEEYMSMSPIDQDFYSEVYRQYLTDLTPTHIIGSRIRDETITAAYKLTGWKEILKLASDRVRDTCFGGDLGL